MSYSRILASVVTAASLSCPALSLAQTTRPPQPATAVCEIGDVTRMTRSATRVVDYSGTWVLDTARSEKVPALWRNAREVIVKVTQDAERLTQELRVFGLRDTMTYEPLAYRLDGTAQNTLGGTRDHVSIDYGLRYAEGGKAVVLRSVETADIQGATLVQTLTHRLELTEGGRTLVTCRILENRAIRTVSRLTFKRQ